MKEISFGPVVNVDGSPTEFTKQMFRVESPREEQTRYYNRIEELRAAIEKDFAKEKWYNNRYTGATLEATRQCIVEMQELYRQINRLADLIADQIVEDMTHTHSGEYSESCVKCILQVRKQ